MNSYQPNYMNQPYNPYGFQNMQQPLNRYQQPEQVYMQNQSTYKQRLGLQGKSVDSIEVVKAMDIPLDGTISYFPLTDGSAIITKQLLNDGSSRTIIYKPANVETPSPEPKYVTESEWNENMQNIKQEVENIKKQIKDIISNKNNSSDNVKERKK